MKFQYNDIIDICTIHQTALTDRLLSYHIIYHNSSLAQKKQMINALLKNSPDDKNSQLLMFSAIISECETNTFNYTTIKILTELDFDIGDFESTHGSTICALLNNYFLKNSGLVDYLELLIELGADVNYINKDKSFPLTIALANSATEIGMTCVKLLIKAGANVNLCTANGDSALTIAAIHCSSTYSIACVNVLIESGADLESRDIHGQTVLTIACRYCNDISSMDCVKLLIDSGANINSQDIDGETALMNAVIHSNTTSSMECVEYLVKMGANINLVNNESETALILAIHYCNIESVKFLLKSGASIGDNINSANMLSMCFVREYNIHMKKEPNPECFKFILDLVDANSVSKYGNTILINICADHECEHNFVNKYIETLINHGVDLNVQNDSGWTALMYSIHLGNTKGTTLLINAGAKLDLYDINKTTALMISTSNRQVELTKALIDSSADMDLQSADGHTALMIACSNCHYEIVSLLVEAGANLDLQREKGHTALMIACSKWHYDIVELLVNAGADLELESDDEESLFGCALDYARSSYSLAKLLIDSKVCVFNGDISTACLLCDSAERLNVIKLMLEYVSDKDVVNDVDDNGTTILMALSEHEWQIEWIIKCMKLVIKYGADLNIKDHQGRTALLYAFSSNPILENIECLINLGANINIQDDLGRTLLMELLRVENFWTGENCGLLKKIIVTSNVTLKDNQGFTAHDMYLHNSTIHTIIDDYEVELLKGTIRLNMVKSAR